MAASKVRITIEIHTDDARDQARIIERIGGDFDIFRAKVLKVAPAATLGFDVVRVRASLLRVSDIIVNTAPVPAEQQALDVPQPSEQPKAVCSASCNPRRVPACDNTPHTNSLSTHSRRG